MIDDYYVAGCYSLIGHIIRRALKDLHAPCYRREAIAFFAADYFCELCDLGNVDAQSILTVVYYETARGAMRTGRPRKVAI